jgi:amino acid adenylation domain-containing protein
MRPHPESTFNADGGLLDVLHYRASTQAERRVFSFRTYVGHEFEDVHLNFGELALRARSLGGRLQELGLEGERALLLYPSGLEFVTAFLGCLSAGVAAVPTPLPRPNRPMERVRAIIEDARPRVVLTTAALAAERSRWSEHAPELGEIPWVANDAISAECAARWRDPGIGPQTLAFLQYTSGSTDEPKGVMVTHGNLLHNAALIACSFRSTPESRGVFWLPLHHDMGLIGGVLQTIYCGGATLLMSPVAFLQEPVRWLEAISQTRATITGGPNFAYDLCVRKITPEQRTELDLSHLEVAFDGAEPVRATTLDQFVDAFAPCGFRREAFLPCYGLAEATLMVSGRTEMVEPLILPVDAPMLEQNRVSPARNTGPDARTLVGCGRIIADQEVIIVDPAARHRCALDCVGEIWVAGASVARGYWNRPDETATTFQATLSDRGPSRYLRTGDLGFLRDGELFVTGRLKDAIIIRGRNVYPQDLEATAARSHPLLRAECGAAFCVEVDGEEHLIIANEVERRTKQQQTDEIIAAIREAVAAEHEIEVDAVLLLKTASIPKTTSGKIRRHACRTGFVAGTLDLFGSSDRIHERRATEPGEAAGGERSPQDVPLAGVRSAEEIQAWLVARVAAMLGVDPTAIEPDLSLSQLGLGSLRIIGLAGDLQRWLGRPCDAALFYREATLAEHAAALAEWPDEQRGVPAAEAELLTSSDQPLSYGQRSLWSLHQLNPESAAYNIAGAVRIRGPLDIEAMRSAFQTLTHRHAALRTRFAAVDGQPFQQVQTAVAVDFEFEDVSSLSEAEVSLRVTAVARQPFDLVKGPLLRVRLFIAAERDPILMLAIHHLVSDFWSVAILIDEFGRIYPALRSGRLPDLVPATRQAADFARSQIARLAREEGKRLWAYWRSKLAGPLPALDLLTDRPRPALRTDRGATRSLHLDHTLSQRLVALAAEHGSSLYVALLAAFQVLLYRYTGQDDVIVGSPAAGRNQPEFQSVVGYLVNTLPMRSDLSGNPTFAALMGRVRGTVLEALANQDFPFALMVDRLGVPRDPSRTPIFSVMFVFQQAQVLESQGLTPFALRESGPRMELGGLAIESIDLDFGTAQFDLTLVAAEREEHLALSMEYNIDLFDAATIDRLLDHFQTLLESIVAAPVQPIASLGLLPAAERRLLVSTWGTHRAEPPPAEVISQLFVDRVIRNPLAPAIVFGDQELTYAALDERANRLAGRLRKLGVRPEAKVGLCVSRSMEMIVGILGILKAGGAYVPLDPDFPAERLEFLLADAGIGIILTQEHLRGRFTDRPDRALICLDTKPGSGNELDTVAQGADADSASLVTGENLAYIIYTSGSTGTPKGVMVSHRNLVHSTHARLQFYDEPISAFLLLSSVAVDSSVAGIFGTLCQGGKLVLPPPGAERDPALLGRLIADHQVSHLLCVPSLYDAILTAVTAEQLAGLHVAIVAGEPCRPALVERHFSVLPDTALVNEYGPTEATVWCSALRCRRYPECTLVPIGRPVAHAALYVLDPWGELAPIGVVGELYVGGAGVARGYLNQPELTAERFLPDRFGDARGGRLYRTGDLARWLADGNLEFHGRIDDQVKVRGHRIELGEVEAVLLGHPAVREGVVVVREDVRSAARLVAYLVTDLPPASVPSRTEWRRWARSHLPESMVPSAFVVVDRLPRLPNRKVDRKALPAPDPIQSAPGGQSTAPRNPVEEQLARIAAEVLGRDQIGVGEDLIDLGLDSILSIQIATRARQSGLQLSPAQLFQHTTIAELAENAAPGAHSISQRLVADDTLVLEHPAAESGVAPHIAPDGLLLRDVSGHRSGAPAPAALRTVVESFGVYLPPKVVSTAEVVRGCHLPLDFPLERITGIRSRHMAGEAEFAIDLAEKAVIDCFSRSAYEPRDIDLLICCNISRCDGPNNQFSYEPTTAARLQRRFDLEHAVAFDISNACAGTFTAIAIADAFLKNGAVRRALITSGEYITHLTQTAQKEITDFLDPRIACLTLGDSGVAIVLERSRTEGAGFQELDLYTLGKYSNLCIAKATDRPHGGAIMLTDSIQGAAVTIRAAVGHSLRTLDRWGWKADSLDQIIMHQTSATTLDGAVGQINRILGRTVCDRHNTMYDLAERGNTATNSHFVAVRDAIRAGALKTGSRVLFAISGSGQTVGTALYTFDDLPERVRQSAQRKKSSRAVAHRAGPQALEPRVRIESLGTFLHDDAVPRDSLALARQAAERCLADWKHCREEVGLIIHTGVYRTDFLSEPAVAAITAGALQINDDGKPARAGMQKTLAFDLMNGGVGSLSACYAATQMIRAGRTETALIVASEIENNGDLGAEHQIGLVEMGSALLLELTSGPEGFGRFVFRSLPGYGDDVTAHTVFRDSAAALHYVQRPVHDRHLIAGIQEAVAELLRAEGLPIESIVRVFPPHRSRSFVAELARALDIPLDRFLHLPNESRDYFTSSLAATLEAAMATALVQPGDVGLLIAAGAGVQIGCATYVFGSATPGHGVGGAQLPAAARSARRPGVMIQAEYDRSAREAGDGDQCRTDEKRKLKAHPNRTVIATAARLTERQ